jgi:hypothetical protein
MIPAKCEVQTYRRAEIMNLFPSAERQWSYFCSRQEGCEEQDIAPVAGFGHTQKSRKINSASNKQLTRLIDRKSNRTLITERVGINSIHKFHWISVAI